MASKLYVGNLSWSASEDDLKAHFEKVGAVEEAIIVNDRDTGRSRGFGFVTMENAQEAIQQLNGQDFQGRPLKVNEAQERPKKTGGGGKYGGGGYGRK